MAQKVFTSLMNILIIILCYFAYKDGEIEYAIYFTILFSIYLIIDIIIFIFKRIKAKNVKK